MSAQTLTRESAESIARDYFRKVDVLDVDGTVSLCDEDSVVTFGNNAGIKGLKELREMFGGFFNLFDKMHHDIRDISIDAENNIIFIESEVGYYIKGNKEESPVVVPVMSVMRMKSVKAVEEMMFKDFRVYIDLAPVMAMIVPHHHSKGA